MNNTLGVTYRLAKRIVIAIVGGTILLIGLVMLVLPGPGLLVIPIGLGILGIEFAWARVWLKRVKQKGSELADKIKNGVRNGGGGPSSGSTT
jgi:tellurite resistance protein TerC